MKISALQRVLVTCLLLMPCWVVSVAVNLSESIPVGPQVKIGQLPNGLTYYIQKNNKPEKRVELRLVVKAGSILEDDDQQGLAHFTEHMAFDGSRHFQKHELISYLQSIGIKFGADLNAYTSFDETVYILPIPTDKKENLETGMLVLEDWAQGVTMEDDAIEQERPVVLEEARLGKGAGERMNKALMPAVFNGSKYAQRLPIGKESLLKSFPHEVIRRFYADWYRPDLMAVVVVGDVEPEQAERMIQERFAQLKNPANERPRMYAHIPIRSESTSLIITDKEATNNSVLIRYPIQPAVPVNTFAEYRESIVRNLYNALLNQHLQELTQQANPPFLSASSGISAIAHNYESFSSSAVLGRGGAGPAISAVVQEQERARQEGFRLAELERAKKNMLRDYESAYKERDKTESARYAAEYIRHFLLHESIPGIVNEYAYVSELLPGIAIDEINQYARRITPNNKAKLVAYLGASNDAEPVPTSMQLLEWVGAAEKAPVVAKNEEVLSTTLMAQPPKPGSIISEKQNQQLGISELILSNGLKVVLKRTDFKNDQVLMSAIRFGGQSLFDEKDMYNARYASSVVASMGFAHYSPIEIGKVLAGKKVNVQMNSGYYTDNIAGFANDNDIETMFQLLYLHMTSPRKDSTLFQSFVNKAQDASKDAMLRPEAIFQDALQSTLYDNHPRLVHLPKPDDFNHIDIDRALAVYMERFGSAKGMTWIIVGSFDPEKIKPLIATYLARLPTGDIVTQYRDLGIRPIPGVVRKEVRSGVEPKSNVSLHFTGPVHYSLKESTIFHMLIDVINLQVTDILREKLSLIYGGGMSGSFTRIPYPNYVISSYLPCGPENVDKVRNAMFEQIEKLKNEGPQQSDIDKVKKNWHEQHRIGLRTNEHWLGYLQDVILYDTDPADILTYDSRIEAITRDDVRIAASRYFDTANYVEAVLYPIQ